MANYSKVAVIGGGIIGTTTSLLALQKIPNIELTLISDKFSPYTTADGAAGIINPCLLGETPNDKIRKWFKKTKNFFQEIFLSQDAGDYGVGLISFFKLFKEAPSKKFLPDIYVSCRPMLPNEMALFPSDYKCGAVYTSYVVDCTKLLPRLLKRIKNLGGEIVKRKIENFEELHGKYDVVINCTGLRASELVVDSKLIPIRGHIIRVRAPWLKHGVANEDSCVVPNSEEVICGSRPQIGDWNLSVNQTDHKDIWDTCTRLVPSLKNAKVIRDWVGLRPGRTEPRIERETVKTEKGELQVIHNYGHGGSGITIGWGCAHDAVEIIEDVLNEINLKKLASHL